MHGLPEGLHRLPDTQSLEHAARGECYGTGAAITGALSAAPDFLDDGLYDTATPTNLAPSLRSPQAAPGAAGAAIEPFTFWRSITGHTRTFEFAFADSDSTGRPTSAVVTLTRTFTGTFNIVPRDPSNPDLPDTDLVVMPNQDGHILNPVVRLNPDGKGGTVTKIGIDAMAPFQGGIKFERVRFQDVDLARYDIVNA